MTQTVIVYNSIAQQRIDEALSNSEYTFPLMIAALIFIICIPVVNKPIEKILRIFVKDRNTIDRMVRPITLIVSAITSTLVFVFML